MVIHIAQQFHLVLAAEVYLIFCSFLLIKENERKKVSWNPSLRNMQFDLILFEEGKDCGSFLCADVGHENV